MTFDFKTMSEAHDRVEYDENGAPITSWKQIRVTPAGAEEYERFREELLAKVRSGELTPETAQEISTKQGGERFEVRFVYPAEDPTIAMWSPEMVAAWITTKDLSCVLRHCKDYYTGKSLWVKNNNVYSWPPEKPAFLQEKRYGHDLIELGKTSLFVKGINFKGTPFDYSNMKWFEKLREVLVDGRMVKATGTKVSTSQREPIKSEDWQFLEFRQDEQGETVLCMPGKSPKYRDITFLAREVRTSFPNRYGFARERINLREVRQWKANPEKRPKGKRLFLYSILKNEFKDGFPLNYRSDKERLAAVRKLMGNKYWHKDDDSFKRYLNGLLRDLCED